ncbi:heparanase-like protein 1 [Magnolia sinica]|uniref:heparanase-like protein 1 n=1 Tax=Magnolia sinica TaxID=86752 RepID=UPI0026584D2E|nr:heparanase-like protein 1 [Magnolia sinica]
MGFQAFFVLFLCSLPEIFAQEAVDATIVIEGAATISKTDDNFVCATLDWWPPEKCNYDHCPWGQASVLNLDLDHPFLATAIKAFHPLRIRVGGSLQDQVVYDVGKLGSPCHPFRKMADGLFGFSKGCLRMDRWDELNLLFKKTGSVVTFGLNALYGRHQIKKGVWGGAWNSSNARSLIEYTISKGYNVDSWEFGNELSGKGIGASVGAEQYGKDLIGLKAILNNLYKKSKIQPSLLAPGGFFEKKWYTQLLQVSGSNVVDVLTHHIYNLGAGVDPHLVDKILDPHQLSHIAGTFRDLQLTIKTHGPWASAWVGESGGAYNSGGRRVSDTFVNSFWYLDQLGMASKYGTKAYCRQSLLGGNYGLLNKTTFVPNPDYYSALLWHRLMGKGVLAVNYSGSPFLRAYAHCSKGKAGVTLLLINLSNTTEFAVTIRNEMNLNHRVDEDVQREGSFMTGLKRTVAWVGRKASDVSDQREEYHLTPKDGYLRSQTMLLNGNPLELTEDGNIPALDPVLVDVSSPIAIAPLSIAFASLPKFESAACA